MAQKSSGSQQGTRHKLSRDSDDTLTVNDYMKEFEEGERVRIGINPSVQEGRIHSRFHGKTAEVTGSRGEAVEIEVSDGDNSKQLFVKPVHLEKVDSGGD